MNKKIHGYILYSAFLLTGLSVFIFSGKSNAENIPSVTTAGGGVQPNVGESYQQMSSTASAWARGKDGTVVQNGPLIFGNDKTTTTIPTMPLFSKYSTQEPYYNTTNTINVGSIIIANSSSSFAANPSSGMMATSSNTLLGTIGVVTATTSVWGVAADTCPANTVCNMITHGFALVLTTGTIFPGDLIVSSAAAPIGGSLGPVIPGFGGKFTGTVAVGTVIGTAVGPGSAGIVAGGLTPVLIDKQ